jgi:hypothetical protein
VRGDAALVARLLLRGTGLAGLVAATGGVVAIAAAARPWYAAVVTVEMLGDEGERTVATLAGVPGTLGGWAALGLGVVALALGVLIAIDRPPAWSRWGLAGVALSLVVVGLAAARRIPDPRRVAGEQSLRLTALAERLPAGVELEVASQPRGAIGILLAAAGLVALGAIAAREA